MDISQIKARPIELPLKHPATGEPVGLTLTLVSRDSEEFRVSIAMSSFVQIDGRPRDMAIQAACACITAWTWADDANWNGEKHECTSENKLTVLRAAPWILNQINQAFADNARFFEN